jgi:hypothetical protein
MDTDIPFDDSFASAPTEALLDNLEVLSTFLDELVACSEGLGSGAEWLPGLGSEGAGCTDNKLGEFVALVFI